MFMVFRSSPFHINCLHNLVLSRLGHYLPLLERAQNDDGGSAILPSTLLCIVYYYCVSQLDSGDSLRRRAPSATGIQTCSVLTLRRAGHYQGSQNSGVLTLSCPTAPAQPHSGAGASVTTYGLTGWRRPLRCAALRCSLNLRLYISSLS